MLRAMNEKEYEVPEVLEPYIKCEKEVNRHAVALGLVALSKCFDLLIPHLDKTIDHIANKRLDKISASTLKRIYVFSSKVYISDFVLYCALTSNE
jgi:hypothetical protein